MRRTNRLSERRSARAESARGNRQGRHTGKRKIRRLHGDNGFVSTTTVPPTALHLLCNCSPWQCRLDKFGGSGGICATIGGPCYFCAKIVPGIFKTFRGRRDTKFTRTHRVVKRNLYILHVRGPFPVDTPKSVQIQPFCLCTPPLTALSV